MSPESETSIRVPRLLREGAPCVLAAEIGINHNGDLALARRMIEAAAEAGADAVKFQNYRTEDFLSGHELSYTYVSQGRELTESQYAMFRRCELPPGALAELRVHALACGLAFFSTPTSAQGVDELVDCGADFVKNGSDCLGHLPLIEAMARSGLTTVLSTGMATLADIDDAVRAFRGAGGRELVLLHCTSAYPTPPEHVHLRKIPSLRSAFGVPVGLSDHSEGTSAALGAIALGACMIEKHFTTDRDLPGPDQRFSSDPAEFRELVRAARTLEACLGQGAIGPTPAELEGRAAYRLSCVARAALPAGHTLRAHDIAFRRPGHGLAPKHADLLLGRALREPVAAGALLRPEELA